MGHFVYFTRERKKLKCWPPVKLIGWLFRCSHIHAHEGTKISKNTQVNLLLILCNQVIRLIRGRENLWLLAPCSVQSNAMNFFYFNTLENHKLSITKIRLIEEQGRAPMCLYRWDRYTDILLHYSLLRTRVSHFRGTGIAAPPSSHSTTNGELMVSHASITRSLQNNAVSDKE